MISFTLSSINIATGAYAWFCCKKGSDQNKGAQKAILGIWNVVKVFFISGALYISYAFFESYPIRYVVVGVTFICSPTITLEVAASNALIGFLYSLYKCTPLFFARRLLTQLWITKGLEKMSQEGYGLSTRAALTDLISCKIELTEWDEKLIEFKKELYPQIITKQVYFDLTALDVQKAIYLMLNNAYWNKFKYFVVGYGCSEIFTYFCSSHPLDEKISQIAKKHFPVVDDG